MAKTSAKPLAIVLTVALALAAGLTAVALAQPQSGNLVSNSLCDVAVPAGAMPPNFTDYAESYCADRSNPATLIGQLRAYALNVLPGDPKGQTAYRRDLDRAGAFAKAQLDAAIQKNAYWRPAIVLDIDETSLSNLDQMLNNDFAYSGDGACNSVSTAPSEPKPICGSFAWDAKAKSPAIAATKALFDDAIQHHVAVFFITGRHEFERGATETNLKNAHYDGYAHLFMEPNDQSFNSAADFKIATRKSIQNMGFHIILNVGDQMSDLTGEAADVWVQYPNPFYRLP